MKKIIFVFLFAGIVSISQINAQESLFSIQYSMGFGTGDLKEFNESASFRGMSFDYRYMMDRSLGIGFETGYNLFYDKMDYATYTRGTESLSGVQFRYTHSVPVLAAFDYYFIPDTQFNPYIGVGIGTIYSNRDIDMGTYRWKQDVWQFGLRPEIGVIIATSSIDFVVGAKYYNGFKANDFEGQQYFTINLGLVF